jgi:hypothetical protein
MVEPTSAASAAPNTCQQEDSFPLPKAPAKEPLSICTKSTWEFLIEPCLRHAHSTADLALEPELHQLGWIVRHTLLGSKRS